MKYFTCLLLLYSFLYLHSFVVAFFFFFNLTQGCLDDYFAPYHECIKSNQTSTTQLLCQYPTLNLQTHLKYTTATTKYYFRHL